MPENAKTQRLGDGPATAKHRRPIGNLLSFRRQIWTYPIEKFRTCWYVWNPYADVRMVFQW